MEQFIAAIPDLLQRLGEAATLAREQTANGSGVRSLGGRLHLFDFSDDSRSVSRHRQRARSLSEEEVVRISAARSV